MDENLLFSTEKGFVCKLLNFRECESKICNFNDNLPILSAALNCYNLACTNKNQNIGLPLNN